jgi:hypothetical protein
MKSKLLGKGTQVSVAIGTDRIVAVLPGTTVTAAVECEINTDTDAAALVLSLRALQQALSAAAGRSLEQADVVVALLPPLYEARLISLPPLSNAEANAIVQREAARYFVGGAFARAVAVQVSAKGLPTLAVAAPATLLEQVHAATASIGWQVTKIVPAISAWLAATRASGRQRGVSRLTVAQCSDVIHVLRIDQAPVQLRRVPLESVNDVLAAAGSGPGHAWVWGDSTTRPLLERGLTGLGWQIQPATSGHHDAYLAAAHHAGTAELELMAQSFALAQSGYQRALALRIAGIAALLVLGAAVMELWGASRELKAVRARRAEIRAEVGPLLAIRDSVASLQNRVEQVQSLKREGPGITDALFDLALLLPEDAHLRSLHATGDTLVMEAAGGRAGIALEAVRASAALHDVKLRGTVERDLEGGTTTSERFTFAARLGSRDAKPPKPAPRTPTRTTSSGSPRGSNSP